jgi:hypothetical protein
VGQQVDHHLRPIERPCQRSLVEDVRRHGPRAERRQPLTPGRRAGHARHLVTGAEQLADDATPDHTRRTCNHDLVHVDLTRHPGST